MLNHSEQLRFAWTCLDVSIPGMAWLYKPPRSQFWQIGWRVGNKLFNRSTKVTNRVEAEKKLALFDLMADASREKRLAEGLENTQQN
jgi:hypothetical protein